MCPESGPDLRDQDKVALELQRATSFWFASTAADEAPRGRRPLGSSAQPMLFLTMPINFSGSKGFLTKARASLTA